MEGDVANPPFHDQLLKAPSTLINRTSEMNGFEFVVLASKRVAQLMRGCTPRLPGSHKPTTMARMEVANGKVVRATEAPLPETTVVLLREDS
jgi:DNA-directed RNA polymerase subunit K/omega